MLWCIGVGVGVGVGQKNWVWNRYLDCFSYNYPITTNVNSTFFLYPDMDKNDGRSINYPGSWQKT